MAKMTRNYERMDKRVEMVREDIKVLSDAWEHIIVRLVAEPGEEGRPPVEDLRVSARLAHAIAKDMAWIEKKITDIARAEGYTFTPSPGMPCEYKGGDG